MAFTDLQSWTDAHEVLLNGKQVVQDAQFLRARSAQPLARGNAVNVLQFSVTRQHVSVAEAAAFVLTAFSSLPGSGAATMVCGAIGEDAMTCTFSAVLEEMPKGTFFGTRSDTTFRFARRGDHDAGGACGERSGWGAFGDGLRLSAGRDGGWREFGGCVFRRGAESGWGRVGVRGQDQISNFCK